MFRWSLTNLELSWIATVAIILIAVQAVLFGLELKNQDARYVHLLDKFHEIERWRHEEKMDLLDEIQRVADGHGTSRDAAEKLEKELLDITNPQARTAWAEKTSQDLYDRLMADVQKTAREAVEEEFPMPDMGAMPVRK